MSARLLRFPDGRALDNAQVRRPIPLSNFQRLAGELQRRRPGVAVVIEQLVDDILREAQQ